MRSNPPNRKNRLVEVEGNIQQREERIEKWASKKDKKYNQEPLAIWYEVLVKNTRTGKWGISLTILDARNSILIRNGAQAQVGPTDARFCVMEGN